MKSNFLMYFILISVFVAASFANEKSVEHDTTEMTQISLPATK